jgi:1-pyrroline-5-carboxylate dehydrogenase
MDAVTHPPVAVNEPVRQYPPGSAETVRLAAALKELEASPLELTTTIGGRQSAGRGQQFAVVQPHRHAAVLGTGRGADAEDVGAAVDAALATGSFWRDLPFDERAAVFLRAADLLAGPWRDIINASTMLGQSKTCFQAEIDAACEMIDFWRFNVGFAREILAEQPLSGPGMWNRLDHRPLEGFVLAITPFNFTSIAGNLPTAPALMGNTVVWKPSPTQAVSAQLTLRLLEAAGLPPGVINLIHGDGKAVSEIAVPDRALAGIHFTGSTGTFQALWRAVGENLTQYRNYPRLVGETGGKDFVVAHPSAEPEGLVTALIRGAFEYQGQKCSAASRAYIPQSLWRAGVSDALWEQAASISFGDIHDFSLFGGAVIDSRSFERLSGVLAMASADPAVKVLAGGGCHGEVGYFVEPTVLVCSDPGHEIFRQEYFGPILAVHVYDDEAVNFWPNVLDLVDTTADYALTGAVFATERSAIDVASRRLRFTAGNFYVNDKPTGAVVGQQPFGGSRSSGTNDKAGSIRNLHRWTSPRSIKETFVPPREYRYPHQG